MGLIDNEFYIRNKIESYTSDINIDMLNQLLDIRKKYAIAYIETNDEVNKNHIFDLINYMNNQISMVMGINNLDKI